jgi:nucleoside 2-deoxyribosyltransferase
MKIYLASKFSMSDEVSRICSELEKRGHIITVKWWKRKDLKLRFESYDDDKFYGSGDNKYAIFRDLNGIDECRVFILIGGVKEPLQFTGGNIELGYAYAKNKMCFSIGKIKKSALYTNLIRCKDWMHFLTMFRDLERYTIP